MKRSCGNDPSHAFNMSPVLAMSTRSHRKQVIRSKLKKFSSHFHINDIGNISYMARIAKKLEKHHRCVKGANSYQRARSSLRTLYNRLQALMMNIIMIKAFCVEAQKLKVARMPPLVNSEVVNRPLARRLYPLIWQQRLQG